MKDNMMVNYFGMQMQAGGGFRPAIKWKALAGHFVCADKDNFGEQHETIVPNNTLFAVDFGTLQNGWVAFSVNGPVRNLVPFGQPLPEQPTDVDSKGKPIFKPGICLAVAGKALGGVREILSSTIAFIGPLYDLYTLYEGAPEAAQGKIPLVVISDVVKQTTGAGAQKNTTFRPVFTVQQWVDRPDIFGPRTVPPPTPKASSAAPALAVITTSAPPPAVPAKAKEPEPALVDNEMPF